MKLKHLAPILCGTLSLLMAQTPALAISAAEIRLSQVPNPSYDPFGLESSSETPSADPAETYVAIAAVFLEAGEIDRAVAIATKHLPLGFHGRSRLLAEAARRYTAEGQQAKALQIAKASDPFSEQVGVLTEIAVEHARAGRNREALEQLAQAFELARSITDEPWRDNALWLVSRQYSLLGQPAQSQQAAEKIADVNARLMLLLEVAIAYERQDQLDQAGAVFAEMERELRSLPEDSCSNSISITEVVAHLALTGQYDQALNFAQSLVAPCRRTQALTNLAAEYALDGRSAEAAALVEQARVQALKSDSLDFFALPEVLYLLAQGYRAIGQNDVAAQLLAQAQQHLEEGQQLLQEIMAALSKQPFVSADELALRNGLIAQVERNLSVISSMLESNESFSGLLNRFAQSVTNSSEVEFNNIFITVTSDASIRRARGRIATGQRRLLQVFELAQALPQETEEALRFKISNLSYLAMLFAEEGYFDQADRVADLVRSLTEDEEIWLSSLEDSKSRGEAASRATASSIPAPLSLDSLVAPPPSTSVVAWLESLNEELQPDQQWLNHQLQGAIALTSFTTNTVTRSREMAEIARTYLRHQQREQGIELLNQALAALQPTKLEP
jgi:tetratricopeptide (TPR) repeat protein